MTTGRASPEPAAQAWFVQAGERVWGPYPLARIESFVAEGRVAAITLLGQAPGGPFSPAARHAALAPLFGGAAAPAGAAPTPTPAAGRRPLLVWARLQSHRPDRFEQGLAAYGPFVRLGEGLWLVRAGLSPAGLRNALTRKLDAADALMVLEAPLDQAAWFNFDGETDRALRTLWGEG